MLVLALGAGQVGTPVSAWGQDTRTVQRDVRRGGAPSLAVAELAPVTDDEVLMEALVALGAEQPALALEEIPGRLEGAEPALRTLLVFAHAYALYLDEQWEAAEGPLSACASGDELFADYCMYWSAQSAFERQDIATALSMAQMVAPDAVVGPRSRVLAARSFALQERWTEAVDRFVAFLADYPTATYRREVEFDLARAYEATGEVEEAARIYHRIALLSPGSADETTALAALERFRDDLPEAVRAEVFERSAAEVVERARVLFDRHRSDQVTELLAPVIADPATPTLARCHASYMVGKSFTKLRQHGDAVPPYELAVTTCQGIDDEERVRALYNLGRSYWNVDRNDDAFATFERLWVEHPTSSYADDAYIYAARVRLDQDRENAMVELLNQQVDRYPDGDMLGEAVWLLMARYFRAGSYEEAIAFAERLAGRTGEVDRYTRGRTHYFSARSLELLDRHDEAEVAFEAVVREYPMSWYALLALNRLRQLDESNARALVTELRTPTEQTEEVIELRPPELQQDPFFRRGTMLLRMGLYALAEGEFDKLRSRYSNEPDIEWVLAMLFDQAGAYHLSYHMPSGRGEMNLSYPAGSNVERWQIAYPRPYESHIMRYAADRELDPNMVYAIMRQESGFRPDIESWANARGLLQLMHSTASDMARRTGRGSVSTRQLFNPQINIELGTMYIRSMSDEFSSHPAVVIGCYNGGMGNVGRWLTERGNMPLDLWVEEIPFAQTQHYVKGVTSTYWVYTWLYGESDPWVTLPFDVSSLRD
jgi:soluble lytic murein transglycosylase